MERLMVKTVVALCIYFVIIATNHAQAQQPAPLNKKLLLDMVNDIRSKGCNCGKTYYPPAPPVKWDEKLEKAAQNHSNNMSSKAFFSHTGKDGSRVHDRVTAVKYDWVMCAENIGMRYKTEQAVIQGWKNSPTHCENMMSELFTEIGIAKRGTYWTMVLAMPKE
jgi:uncharacterized protein YkwD